MTGGEAENQERPDDNMSRHSSLGFLSEETSSTQYQSPPFTIQEVTYAPEPNPDLVQSGPDAVYDAVESRGLNHVLAPIQGETLNYYTDPIASGEQRIQKYINKFSKAAFGPALIWEPTWEILVCLSCRGPYPSTMYNLRFFPPRFRTGLYGCNGCSACFIIEVKGDWVVILRSLNLAEILDLFKGHWPSCLLDYPISSTSIGVLGTGEVTFMEAEPAEGQNGGGEWGAREGGVGNAGPDPGAGALQLAHTPGQDGLEHVKIEQQPNRKPDWPRRTDINNGRVSKRRQNQKRRRKQMTSWEGITPATPEIITRNAITAPSPITSSSSYSSSCSPSSSCSSSSSCSTSSPCSTSSSCRTSSTYSASSSSSTSYSSTTTSSSTTGTPPPKTDPPTQAGDPLGHPASETAGETVVGLFCTQCGMQNGVFLPSCFSGSPGMLFTCVTCGGATELYTCGEAWRVFF